MNKILVAEDDKYLANAYRVKLAREGYEVRIVFNGQEVIKVLEEFVPDIIILDLIMPVMDGYSVLEYLKKTPILKDIPVIIASNLGQSEDIVKATKLGAADYIVKTDLSMKKVSEKIQAVLQNKQELTNGTQLPQNLQSQQP